MNEPIMMLGYLAPMVAVLGLFWNVARKLGQIESDLRQVRRENDSLRADVQALRDLLSVVIDSRRSSP
jgi:ribosomal protein L13E